MKLPPRLSLRVWVEGLGDLGGDAGRDAAGDAGVDVADLDDRALVDLEVEGAGGLGPELLVAALHVGQQEALALVVGAQVGGLAHGGLGRSGTRGV